jgi:hypothetical protein
MAKVELRGRFKTAAPRAGSATRGCGAGPLGIEVGRTTAASEAKACWSALKSVTNANNRTMAASTAAVTAPMTTAGSLAAVLMPAAEAPNDAPNDVWFNW